MSTVPASIEAEFRRYKALADAAMAQLSDEQLNQEGPNAGLSVATIARHIAGNLNSRFTGFLTEDGEKPWRDREREFDRDPRTSEDMNRHWEAGWQALFEALAPLTDEHLSQTIQIRGAAFPVVVALHRALAHISYHVGQIVYLAKAWRGTEWKYLSIPPGGSDAFNQQPAGQAADAHVARLSGKAS